MSSVTVTAIRDISRRLQSELAPSGWRRKSPHLIREHAGVVQGLHFQASQFGSSESGTFTINLVVTEPRIYQAWCRKPFPTNPATALFPVQERIGRLAVKPRDHWWKIDADTNLSTVEAEVSDLVRKAEDTFFPHFLSLDNMLSRLRSTGTLPGLHGGQHAVVHGLIAAILGHTSEAKEVLKTAAVNSKVPGFTDNIRAAAKNVGIEI